MDDIVRTACILCFCLVMVCATIKPSAKPSYEPVAGPFVSQSGGYIFDVVEEVNRNVG